MTGEGTAARAGDATGSGARRDRRARRGLEIAPACRLEHAHPPHQQALRRAGGHVKGLRESENEPYFTIDRSSGRLAVTMSRSFRMLSR
jgi:hypothetical protein